MKTALWITCGPRGNAGDGLLYDVTRALFDGKLDLDFRFVSEPQYLRPGDEGIENVVIGPGGLFVQTNSSKHLHEKLTKQWDQFANKRFFLWSTGILEKPKPEEVPLIRRVTERAERIVVRANRESEFFQDVAGVDSEWSPCASLFTDKLLGIKKNVKDVVVVNFDDFLFTEENIADHPLKRFIAYANSEGLEVRSMINASGDSNRYMLDLFPVIEADEKPMRAYLGRDERSRNPIKRVRSRLTNSGINEAIENMPSFGARYTDARFAFGKRLHGWLPFLAFDQPAAFIGMRARRGMPKDYFGNNDFLCAVPRKSGMDRESLDSMTDKMIRRLGLFIRKEEKLSSQIAERREVLWNQLQRQADEFAAALH